MIQLFIDPSMALHIYKMCSAKDRAALRCVSKIWKVVHHVWEQNQAKFPLIPKEQSLFAWPAALLACDRCAYEGADHPDSDDEERWMPIINGFLYRKLSLTEV